MPLDDYGSLLQSGYNAGIAPLAFQQRQQQVDNDTAQVGIQQQQVDQQGALIAAKVRAEQAEAVQKARYAADVDRVSKSNDPRALSWLLTRYPDQKDALKAAYDQMNDVDKQDAIKGHSEIFSTLSNNRPDLAIVSLEARVAADNAAGKDAAEDQKMLDWLKSGDPKAISAVKQMSGLFIGAVVPDKFASVAEQLGTGDNGGFTLTPGAKRFDSEGKVIAEAPAGVQYRELEVIGEDGKPHKSIVALGGDGNPAGTGVTQRFTGGWTPRARNGGDNDDAAVDGKIAGASQFLGIAPTADISKISPRKVAEAMFLSEGGAGSLADRNNNPGNIKAADGSFRKFPSKEAGINAAAALVARKVKNGQTTIQSLIEGVPEGSVASSGGPQVVAMGAPTTASQSAKMTTAEVKAEGLDPRVQYYRNKDGVPVPVGGQSAKSTVKNLTEGQAKATGLLNAAVEAVAVLDQVGDYSVSEVARGLDSGGGASFLRRGLDQKERRALNAQRAFSNAILRLETGATISPSEINEKTKVLFPMPDDGPEVLADKKAQRAAAVRSLQAAAGPGAVGVQPSSRTGAKTASNGPAAAPKPGQLINGYYFKGGDPKVRSNWFQKK